MSRLKMFGRLVVLGFSLALALTPPLFYISSGKGYEVLSEQVLADIDTSAEDGMLDPNGKLLLVAAPALLLFVLLIWYRRRPSELLTEFVGSAKQALRSCWGLVVKGDSSWLACMFALMCPSLYFAPPLFVIGWLLPSDGVVPPPFPAAITKRVLQPVSLRVNFDNARLDENRNLVEHGVTLKPASRTPLKAALAALDECAQLGAQPITVKLYGFASNDRFRGLTLRESNARNLQAATCRAKSAYETLQDLAQDFDGLTVAAPDGWDTLDEMKKKRNVLVPVPEGIDRDPVADRVVVLKPSALGCEIAQVEGKEEQSQ